MEHKHYLWLVKLWLFSRGFWETPRFKQSNLTPAASTSVTREKDEEVPNVDRNGAAGHDSGPGGGQGGVAWRWGGGWLCRRRGTWGLSIIPRVAKSKYLILPSKILFISFSALSIFNILIIGLCASAGLSCCRAGTFKSCAAHSTEKQVDNFHVLLLLTFFSLN